MGFLDSVKEKINNTEHVEELCDYLNSIGLDARIIDKKGPEAIAHKVPVVGNDILRFPRLGVIKITGQEFEYVEVIRMFMGGGRRASMPSTAYYYAYVLHQAVPKGRDPYSAVFSEKDKEPGRYYWFGNQLAMKLAADPDLQSLMEGLGMPVIKVEGIEADQCVAMVKDQDGRATISGVTRKYGYGDFPSASHIQLYDAIAKHIKDMGMGQNPQ
jgi:hypothetical protein